MMMVLEAQHAGTSKFQANSGYAWRWFSVPGMPMLYHNEAFSWWWLVILKKMLHHLGRILPWCQQHSSIPLDFCWHQLHFLPIWCSIMISRFAFTVSIIFILGCFDTALWSPTPSYCWHPSHFSLFWYSITRSNENRRRLFVCLHGAGPICK